MVVVWGSLPSVLAVAEIYFDIGKQNRLLTIHILSFPKLEPQETHSKSVTLTFNDCGIIVRVSEM